MKKIQKNEIVRKSNDDSGIKADFLILSSFLFF